MTGDCAFDIARLVVSEAGFLSGNGNAGFLSGNGNIVIAGVETGGAIISAMAVGRMPRDWLSLALVRKPKMHGPQGRVVGNVRGLPVLLVDDVATTGGSLASAVMAIRDAGGIVMGALVVVDREEGARARLSDLGVDLVGLCTLTELV